MRSKFDILLAAMCVAATQIPTAQAQDVTFRTTKPLPVLANSTEFKGQLLVVGLRLRVDRETDIDTMLADAARFSHYCLPKKYHADDRYWGGACMFHGDVGLKQLQDYIARHDPWRAGVNVEVMAYEPGYRDRPASEQSEAMKYIDFTDVAELVKIHPSKGR